MLLTMTADSNPDAMPDQSDEIARELNARFGSSRALVNQPLGALTTYRVGGNASVFAVAESKDDLFELAAVVGERNLPVAVIGRGSNLLVADTGFAGVVLQLGTAFDVTEMLADEQVRIAGAASLPVVARQLTAAGHRGFEWAVGVPGSLGGAVRMNAGGHGSDMAASVRVATVVDLVSGQTEEVDAAALEFSYRSSSVRSRHVVVEAVLELGEGDPAVGQALLSEIVRWRRANQPGGQNAGSVFTNPSGDSAGRLIDRSGLKGLRIGTASVSTKHANFIQADPGGSASDIVALMQEIIRRVHGDHGIVLHAETRMIGFGPEETALMFDPEDHDDSGEERA